MDFKIIVKEYDRYARRALLALYTHYVCVSCIILQKKKKKKKKKKKINDKLQKINEAKLMYFMCNLKNQKQKRV